ncbi:MAG TPA: SpoIID/LytB domain-containing protein [Clostridia bacterium]|nr:SpoIID/LytB domain-containing protein [Clostridia bacterium]
MKNKKLFIFFISLILIISLTNPTDAATILKYGMQSPEVKKLQENLNKAGYFVTANPTDYFGRATLNAVIRLQKDYNLVADGIYGPLTEKALMDKLNSLSSSNSASSTPQNSGTEGQPSLVMTRVLKYGCQGEDVKTLQHILNNLGFDVGSADGIFGKRTQEGVVQFQKANGLITDGVVGPITQKALYMKLNANLPSRGETERNVQQNPTDIEQNRLPFTKILQYGIQGEEVRLLQTLLKEIGYYDRDITGIYDDYTLNSVLDFQKYYSLETDGIVGTKTLAKILELDNQVKAIKSFYVQGKGGYGHGVGMTQFGAKGMAEQGFKYEDIIKYYYEGVSIEKRDTEEINLKVRITLDPVNSEVRITSDKPYLLEYTVKDKETGQELINNLPCSANSITIFKYEEGNIAFLNDKIINDNLQASDSNASTVKKIISKNFVRVIPTETGILSYMNQDKSLPYEGEFRIYSDNTSNALFLVNVLPLEKYLRGVIPLEMSPSSPEEALKAQILAARTYALLRVSDKNIYDISDSNLSQVYKGLSVVNDKIDKLIEATKGEVVVYGGNLANTVYSASAGGYTVDAGFAWNSDNSRYPYLKGKPDPYDTSKYATYWWNVSITKDQLSAAYPQIGVVLNIEITNKMFDRPVELKITGTRGCIVVKEKDFRDEIEKIIGQKVFLSEYYVINLQN